MKKKTLINRICTLLCALVVAVGMFGGGVNVKADGMYTLEEIFEIEGWNPLDDEVLTANAGKEYCIYRCNTHGYISIVFLEHGYFRLASTSGSSTGYLCEKYKGYAVQYYFDAGPYYLQHIYSEDGGNTWNYTDTIMNDTTTSAFFNNVGVKWDAVLKTGSSTIANWNYDANPNVLTDFILYSTMNIETHSAMQNNYGFPTMAHICNALPVGSKIDTYSSDIGYLKNLTRKTLFKYGENYTVDTETAINRISFDSFSTTGKDLTDGNYVILVYEQFAVYKRSDPKINVFPNMPKIFIGEYPAENLQFDYNVQDAFDITTLETGSVDGYNEFTIVMNGYIRSDNMYYQIYNETTGEYGGFVMISGDGTQSIVSGSTATTITPDGDIDDTGYIEKPIDSSNGIGNDYDDAEHDANEAVPDGTVSDAMGALEGNLNEFVASVKAIPGVIGSIFGFLPDWCLNLFAVSFGLGCVIFIWKLIRG